jgi:hypothetical protein
MRNRPPENETLLKAWAARPGKKLFCNLRSFANQHQSWNILKMRAIMRDERN